METGDEEDDLEDDDVFVDVIVVVIVFVDVGDGDIGLVGNDDLLSVVVLVDVFDCVAVEEGRTFNNRFSFASILNSC